MKRFALFFAFLCVYSAIIGGCKQNYTKKPVYRAVTQIDIVSKYENRLIRRHYHTPDKMRSVLLYLRLLKPYGKPAAVDETADDIYLISISLSDGTRHYYRQASHRYLSRENGPFKPIDPKQAAGFYGILRELPSDPTPH